MKKRIEDYSQYISSSTKTRVRFNETDPLGIVWHGNYINYFEDGRESFGKEHGISYLDVFKKGYTTPIVKYICENKKMVKYGEIITIKTYFVENPAAKMIFKYQIFNEKDELVCKGETVQVFMTTQGVLELNQPEFFMNWKKNAGIL
jgi:acyl-CoA thioester hydrolase